MRNVLRLVLVTALLAAVAVSVMTPGPTDAAMRYYGERWGTTGVSLVKEKRSGFFLGRNAEVELRATEGDRTRGVTLGLKQSAPFLPWRVVSFTPTPQRSDTQPTG